LVDLKTFVAQKFFEPFWAQIYGFWHLLNFKWHKIQVHNLDRKCRGNITRSSFMAITGGFLLVAKRW
jgi:hypothetical protein